jgi:hypothetical protein
VPILRRFLFGALVVVAIGVEQAARGQSTATREVGYFWGALGLLATAFGIWILDITKTVCVPESLLQGHAVWHMLNACCIGSLYLYYRSEQPQAALEVPLRGI